MTPSSDCSNWSTTSASTWSCSRATCRCCPTTRAERCRGTRSTSTTRSCRASRARGRTTRRTTRRQADRRDRALRDVRSRRGSDHRAGRRPRRPQLHRRRSSSRAGRDVESPGPVASRPLAQRDPRHAQRHQDRRLPLTPPWAKRQAWFARNARHGCAETPGMVARASAIQSNLWIDVSHLASLGTRLSTRARTSPPCPFHHFSRQRPVTSRARH